MNAPLRSVLPQYNCGGVIRTHDVEDLLGIVDPQSPKRPFHQTCRLWSNDFFGYCNHPAPLEPFRHGGEPIPFELEECPLTLRGLDAVR
jgi:hypothetical protein